jgi:phage gpG-like protein
MSRFIEIDFSQLSNILSELQATGKRASDLKPIARTVGLVISSYTDEVFRSSPNTTVGGTVFNGEYWEPLSLEYRAARNRFKKKSISRDNGQLLLDTGKLLQSLQVGSANNFFASGKDFIEFGTNLPQGFNNVSRTFLAPTDSLTELVARAMENYIITGET